MKEKIIFWIFLDFSRIFEEKNLIFWKNYSFTQPITQPNFTIGLGFLAIFHRPWVCWALWKIAKPFKNCTWWSVKLLVWVRQLHATHWDHTDKEWKIYIDLLPLRNRCGHELSLNCLSLPICYLCHLGVLEYDLLNCSFPPFELCQIFWKQSNFSPKKVCSESFF